MDSIISTDTVGNLGNFFSNENPPSILGISSRTFLLLITVVTVAWFLTRRVEMFQTTQITVSGRGIATESEFIQDIRNEASYVGPYVGEIYLYLRAKYFSNDKRGVMFQPGGIDDPTLADPLLPIARTQIKSWIDSNKLRLKDKYGEDFINRMTPTWNLSYEQKPNGVISITYVENGKKATYVI